LNQIKGNSINDWNFLKLIVSFRGGHCDYSIRALKHCYATDGMSGLCMILEVFMDGRDIFPFEVTDFFSTKVMENLNTG
jgi:hypothetical protein